MKNFTEFLKDPKNEPILNSILNFLKEAKKVKQFGELASFSEKFQTFITEQSKIIQDTWNGKYSPKELIELEQALQAMLTRSFSSFIFPILINGDPISMAVDQRVNALKSSIKLSNLDIPDDLVDQKTLGVATDQFKKIQNYSTPKNKINIIINFCKILSYMVQKGAEKLASSKQNQGIGVHAGADQFFPVLVYALFFCGIEQLGAHASFIKFFRHQPKLDSQDQYYFVTFSCALSFIKDMKPSDIHLSPEQFQQLLNKPQTKAKEIQTCLQASPTSNKNRDQEEEVKQEPPVGDSLEPESRGGVAQSIVSTSTCFEEGWDPTTEEYKQKNLNKGLDKSRFSVPSNQVEHQQEEVKALVQRPFETLTVSELRHLYDFVKSSFPNQ